MDARTLKPGVDPFKSSGQLTQNLPSKREMAFHEKAGRSQVGTSVLSLDKVFLFPPRGHGRHASIRTLEERFISLGACWAFSFQPVLPSDYRPWVLLF
jgi:hypothetical protein